MKYKLSLKNISKTFENGKEKIMAVKTIDLDVNKGEIIAIIGTSGCGKSTLLNMIAGLDEPTNGEIYFDKDNPKISYMLQNDALLPWKSVLENATLGLELLKEKNASTINEVVKLLKEYGLYDFRNMRPSSLSGGMKQRVALIRSLAINPDILLLDEPFSALDYYTRLIISEDVLKMIKESGATTLIITHDIAEALCLADRIVVLSSRPATIKNIYEIDLPQNMSNMEKRTLKKFNELYEKIWRDLDVKI